MIFLDLVTNVGDTDDSAAAAIGAINDAVNTIAALADAFPFVSRVLLTLFSENMQFLFMFYSVIVSICVTASVRHISTWSTYFNIS